MDVKDVEAPDCMVFIFVHLSFTFGEPAISAQAPISSNGLAQAWPAAAASGFWSGHKMSK
jgi:hypothetical protein